MTTKIVGIKEFRDNITKYWKRARKENIRYIVMHRQTPVLEVNPLGEEDVVLENLVGEIREARQQVRRGEVYSHEAALRKLGL